MSPSPSTAHHAGQAADGGAPSACVGIVGAGQLARMLYEAALPLGVEVRVLTEDRSAPAVRAGAIPVFGSADNLEDLRALAEGCDVVTFDHELADHAALKQLQATATVRPSPRALQMAQDKLLARFRMTESGLPVPPFMSNPSPATIAAFAAIHGWPVVLKASSGGYDGRGVWVVETLAAAESVVAEASAAGVELLVEAHVEIAHECSVLVARSPSGLVETYPVLDTFQEDAQCREVVAPALISPEVEARACELAVSLARDLDVVGILAVELFITPADELLVNELALRPHNSGHLTIEACVTSQFEQHLRAILDWPLGSTRLLAPNAAMVNVLGVADAGDPTGRLADALAVPEVAIHLYGKATRTGRKLGHVTATGAEPDDVLDRARTAAALLVR